jgi:hypothetical protein
MASDEEANIAAHPKGWIGQEIPNPPEDSAKKLVCLLNFLMPPYQLGNLPGDEERFDHKGHQKIVKEEPVSDDEQVVSDAKSEPDEVEIIAVNPQSATELNPRNLECMAKARNESEEKGDKDPKPEKTEDDEPVQSTSTGITHYNPDPANLRNIPGHLEIDGFTMAAFFAEHMCTDLTLKRRAGKICATWIPDRQDAQEPESMDQDQEPDTTDPAPKNKVNSEEVQPLEDIIQILDDHIAVSPNPAQVPSERETDSGLEEPVTYEREEKETDESENQVIDVVATSASDQEGTIIVDPTTMEEGVQALAREVDDSAVKDVREVSNENNNNQVVEKVMLELQTNRPQTSQLPSQQLLLHQVPI